MSSKVFRPLCLTALCSAIGLAGCGHGGLGGTTCSSDDAMAATGKLIKTQVEADAIAKVKQDDGSYTVPASSIRASVALLKVTLDEIRTIKSDPNSSKKFCTANAKVVFPLNVIDEADKARSLSNQDTVEKLADASDVQRNADSFTFSADYDVQPTDNKQETFAESDSLDPQLQFLSDVIVYALLKPALQNQQIIQQQQAAQQQGLKIQASQAALAQATADNKLSNQTINAAWNAIDPDTRSQILADQRAWIASKAANCSVQAAAASTDPTDREAARLKCDTSANSDRMTWLRQYMPPSIGQ